MVALHYRDSLSAPLIVIPTNDEILLILTLRHIAADKELRATIARHRVEVGINMLLLSAASPAARVGTGAAHRLRDGYLCDN